jgi:hypothetical protein
MESRDRDRLDQWVERALHEYGGAEPRVGLENRILVNLAAQKAQVADRRRWWLAVGTATAIAAVVIAVWLGSGANDRSKSIGNSAYNPPSTKQPKRDANVQPIAKQTTAKAAVQRRWRPHHATTVELAESPKLSQFPSPRPLSEQEQMLTRYVREFHQEAVIVAQAEAQAAAQRELAELAADKPAEIDSDQRER